MTQQLPADTRMSQVALDVADLDLMTRFYPAVLLLEPVSQGSGAVGLGRGGQELVVLRHRPDLPKGERRSAGLFHTALLHPDAAMLATVLASVARRTPELYTGSGDHLVSQAFYLDDPEGNGVELYVDRPRDQWGWNGNQVLMDTLWLDPNAFLAEHLTDTARELLDTAPDRRPALAGAGAQVVGHVHLKVGQTAQAKDFYVDTLGFEVTAELPGALFVSAGGYHHHMAMNTWGTAGVGLRAPGLGLGQVAIEVPTVGDVLDAARRLAGRGLGVALDSGPDGAALRVEDPWGNQVLVATPAG
ncbi:MAG TPA: VOC family protein [Propionicimonas sp.]|nr:VOC family protein [Propionicimonas sp.]